MGFYTHLWKCNECLEQFLYTSNQRHPSINHKCKLKKQNKMKVELIQKTTLTDMYYKIVVNGEFHMSYNDYDEAVLAYDRIKSTIPREEVILSKEI